MSNTKAVMYMRFFKVEVLIVKAGFKGLLLRHLRTAWTLFFFLARACLHLKTILELVWVFTLKHLREPIKTENVLTIS